MFYARVSLGFLMAAAIVPACSDDGAVPNPVPIWNSPEAGNETGDSSSETASGDAGDAAAESGFPSKYLGQPIEWKPCVLDEQNGTGAGECADVTVPQLWDKPDGDVLKLRVKRLRSTTPSLRQLWVNEGGPGGSSVTDFGPVMADWVEYFEADLYAMDHRGTGASARMGCPDQESDASEAGLFVTDGEWPSCIEHLTSNGLDPSAFTVTQAATDQAFVAELFGETGKDLFVYGVSYGTYLAHRYAQLFPEQAKGVILDSIVPSIGVYLDKLDENGIVTIQKVFDRCAKDAFCSAKLGDKPYDTAMATLTGFRKGACPALHAAMNTGGADDAYLQIAAAVLAEGWETRPLMAAAFYRLARCNASDVAALTNVYKMLLVGSGEPTVYDRTTSMALFYHIALSELSSGEPLSSTDKWFASQNQLASIYLDWRVAKMTELGIWPVYTPDGYYHAWAPAKARLLMLNGELDFQTPVEVARTAADHLQGPSQHFVEVPGANHCVLVKSPVKTAGGRPCGLQIARKYLEDPLAAPDTACFADLKPVTFEGDPMYAQALMGTSEAWDGDATPQNRSRALSPEIERALRMGGGLHRMALHARRWNR